MLLPRRMNGSKGRPAPEPEVNPIIETLFGAIARGVPMDIRGIPTAVCPCGYDMFIALIQFDEQDRTIEHYITDGVCALCGTLVTLPTEMDDTAGLEIDHDTQLDDEGVDND